MVEVGEVRAVGLVQVVVDLEERRVRGQDVRGEDRVDRRRGAGQSMARLAGAEVRDRVVEDAQVPDQGQVFEVQDREEEEEEVAEGHEGGDGDGEGREGRECHDEVSVCVYVCVSQRLERVEW